MGCGVGVHFVEVEENYPAYVAALLFLRAQKHSSRFIELIQFHHLNENEICFFWPRTNVTKEVGIQRLGI